MDISDKCILNHADRGSKIREGGETMRKISTSVKAYEKTDLPETRGWTRYGFFVGIVLGITAAIWFITSL